MRMFLFSLEPLLKFRAQKVKILQHEFAHLSRKEKEIKREEEKLQSEMRLLEECLMKRRAEGDLQFQNDAFGYSAHLYEQIHKFQEMRVEQQKNLSLKQQELLKALQERKIVEKLKEKHYSQWKQKILMDN